MTPSSGSATGHRNAEPRAVRRKGLIALDPERVLENGAGEELLGVQRGRVRHAKHGKEVQAGREGDVRIGQADRARRVIRKLFEFEPQVARQLERETGLQAAD